MKTMPNDILYQANYFYKVTGKINNCNMSMWTTTEGAATALKKSKTDMGAVHKLIESEADGRLYSIYKYFELIKKEICQEFAALLRVVKKEIIF